MARITERSRPAWIAAATVALLACLLLIRPAAAQTPDVITGDVPEAGVALLVVNQDASPADIVASLLDEGCAAVSIALTVGGDWLVYIPGAPAFVNAGFPAAVTAGTAIAVNCASSLEGFDDAPIDESDRLGSGLIDVRLGEHDGFDRIVFEFDTEFTDAVELADGVPAYTLEYVDVPVYACGSGEEVNPEGTGTLVVNFPGTFVYDPDSGEGLLDETAFTDDSGVILEVQSTCGFEAMSTWAIGLDGEPPFRVMELANPTRLVIDFLSE